MLYSPHLKLLNNHNDDSYFRLQKMFGRNKKWIAAKIEKFYGVCKSIKEEGILSSVQVLETPLVSNNFNSGYEIYEGHHRVSCAIYLGMKQIPCLVIRR